MSDTSRLRLFASYIGSPVICNHPFANRNEGTMNTELMYRLFSTNQIYHHPYSSYHQEYYSLSLRSVEMLSEEEYNMIGSKAAKEMYHDNGYNTQRGKEIVSHMNLDSDTWPVSFVLWLTDYLRSIGIAIPFMGISVEEMIEKGWVVLRKE